MKSDTEVRKMAGIVFVLFGILFGILIMAFIFGNLNVTTSSSFELLSGSEINETGWINSSGYQLLANGDPGATSFTIQIARNTTAIIGSGNYTVSSTGLVTNTTTATVPGTWQNINFTYTYQYKGNPQVITESISEDGLEGLESYSGQSDTQFLTVAIAITLLILIFVFGVFWKFFMSVGSTSRGKKDSYNYS